MAWMPNRSVSIIVHQIPQKPTVQCFPTCLRGIYFLFAGKGIKYSFTLLWLLWFCCALKAPNWLQFITKGRMWQDWERSKSSMTLPHPRRRFLLWDPKRGQFFPLNPSCFLFFALTSRNLLLGSQLDLYEYNTWYEVKERAWASPLQ